MFVTVRNSVDKLVRLAPSEKPISQQIALGSQLALLIVDD